MGSYKYLSELWRKRQTAANRFITRIRNFVYRQSPTVARVTQPTRPDKAARLGFKKRQGYVVIRVRVRRGNFQRFGAKQKHHIVHGKPVNQGVIGLKNARSARAICEMRAGKRFTNLRVLNSYYLSADAVFKYYEVIMVDPSHSAIRNDPKINWICNAAHTRRECRGLTAAGKEHRGLGKGHRFTKSTPSRRAFWKRTNTTHFKRYR
ncbi:hypothetical protein PCE1_004242 [Barthelona sp. PCE]